MVDASLGEIMTTCEKIIWLLSEGEKWLKPEYRYAFWCIQQFNNSVVFIQFNMLLLLSFLDSTKRQLEQFTAV